MSYTTIQARQIRNGSQEKIRFFKAMKTKSHESQEEIIFIKWMKNTDPKEASFYELLGQPR